MRKLLFLFLTIMVSGCTTTEMTGFLDPQYKNHQISKVVVRAHGATLEETLTAEQKFAEKLNTHNVNTIKFTDIAPPTRKYTLAQEAKLLKKTGADSLFTVYVARKDSVESYVPPTYHAGKTTSTVNMAGNMAYISSHTTPGYTTGGYSVSSPIMATFSNLVDLRNGNEIWRGEGYSSGASSYLDLLLNAGESAIADMGEKGLLSKEKRK